MSALLQECTSLTLHVLLVLLYSPGTLLFSLLCVREGKDAHINVSSFILTVCSLTSKYKLSSHDLVFDLSPIVTSLQKEEHQSQERLVLLENGDLIVAFLCPTRMHSRKNTTEQEPTQQSL